ncbi:elongation of very long chain fatty acids protein 1-like isoform X1 [Malaya genurostris]|uniref:elongation of very long chain fatty acids protein 1-like isoform X1 n=2 Tax=Malaya genurostris TaxID=325434 RepID=UPI0026F3D02F|nr:elongation of very long chain fatty acids protein 1-like isoform X1 [Malaya genurostris]
MDILHQMNLTDFTLYDLINVKGVEDTIDKYPLMASPVPGSILIAIYLYFIYKWGPNFMENRKPFDLKFVIAAYNIFQVIACSYLVLNYIKVGFEFSFIGRCTPKLPVQEYEHGYDAVYYGWLAMCLRMVEFIETVFFVLRKKQNQVSALHVYHHISTFLIVWWSLKLSLSYQEMSIMVLNSIVHIIMYSYYLLSAYKMFRPVTNRVKPIITIIQLAQLVTMLVHVYAALEPTCTANKFIYMLHAINLVILISLFTNFYMQTYIKKSRKVKQS